MPTMEEKINEKKHIIHISSRFLLIGTLVYLYVPMIIFIIGWTNIIFSVIATIGMIIACFLVIKKERENVFEVSISYLNLAIIILLIIIIGLICGWGGLFPQSYDWSKHNAILRDLVSKQWPVIYENNGVKSLLTYYLGQYMVPALGGKISFLFTGYLQTAFVCSEIMQLIWNCIGLFFVLIPVISFLGKNGNPVLKSAAFIFFGSLLPIGHVILSITNSNVSFVDEFYYHNLNSSLIGAQYTTNFVQLRWVFPQCLAVWIVMGLFVNKAIKIRSYIVFGLPLLFFSCFSFIGILPFFFYSAIKELVVTKKVKAWLRECFSIPNVLILLILGSCAVLYFGTYVLSSNKPSALGLTLNYYTIPAYILFCLVSFGIYMLLLIPALKKKKLEKGLLIVSAVVLLILPLYRMGYYNDFTMRVSIPALFILCCYLLKVIFDEELRKERKIYYSVAVVCFLIGIIYPSIEMINVILNNNWSNHQELKDDYESLEYYANFNLDKIDSERFESNGGNKDIIYNYYSYEEDMKLFMNTIGKKK